MRRELPKNKDEKVFRHTAATGKRINLGNMTFRGGIRF